jgi:hypothetical protein
MDIQAKNILNSQELLKVKEEKFNSLKALFAGKPSDTVFMLNSIYGKSGRDPYTEPEKWMEEALESLAPHVDKMINSVAFRPLCVEFGPYGVHFIDKIFGAEVFFKDDQWYNRYLATPIGQLTPPDLEKDETWSLAKRAAKAFIKQEVKGPLLGLPTIASALNIAVNLYGEEILVAMLVEHEEASHDLKVINNLFCELHRWYLNNIPLEQL